MKNFIAVFVIAIMASCGSSSQQGGMSGDTAEAMDMLESVFEGPYSKWAIKSKLDTVLTMYKMELKNENYLKVGNRLVAMRKDGDGSFVEMDIINDMINTNSGAQGVSFDEQLDKSAKALERNLANKE